MNEPVELNPDTYGIRGRRGTDIQKVLSDIDTGVAKVVDTLPQKLPGEAMTYREIIASYIRQLTYRELKQIADEITKCSAAAEDDVAQTLDDWAYMVKDEADDTQGN